MCSVVLHPMATNPHGLRHVCLNRTCLYLVSCCAYLPESEDRDVLQTAYDIYSAQRQFPDAMRIALKMNDQARRAWPLLCCGVPLVTLPTCCMHAALHAVGRRISSSG